MAGKDLTGYTISLYNGSNGASYSTINLGGLVPDQSNGFGALAFFKAGIQNGAPDGLALSDENDLLIDNQLLSYEGSIVATDGVATGLTSTDIGVAESGSTSEKYSLQLTGSNFNFARTGPSAESPWCINANQSFPKPTISVPGTSSVPDSGTSGVLLTLALSGLALLRRMV